MRKMAITISDVRACLNDISTDELADATITDKITEGEDWVDVNNGDTGSTYGEYAIKYYSAYLSYLVSNSYLQASAGPVSVREPYEIRAKMLLDQAVDWLSKDLDKPMAQTKKIPLLREYSSEEQERDPDYLSLTV
jgi:hypothetical protein